jgi:predicted Fe-Mo cluster-binding NifX family protein
MKIAVTSQNFRTITGHAGKARRFLVYEVEAGAEPVEVERIDLPMGMAFHDFKGDGAHPIDGVNGVITGSCGAGFAQRLAARGIQVLVTGETDPISAVRKVSANEPLAAPEPHDHHH